MTSVAATADSEGDVASGEANLPSSASATSGRASRRAVPRPFLKWAGGKGQLLDELLQRVPSDYQRYFEPFLGGGALFFALQPKTAILSDLSRELINCFEIVRDSVEDLIVDLEKHKHTGKYYYRIRSHDREADYWVRSPLERASRFLYLNKTCYNGLYRVNSRGEFNVPFGDYKNPKIVDAENLRGCSRALAGATFHAAPFHLVLPQATKGDFVYLDPPYVPLTETANFTSYGRDGFTLDDQERLFEACVELDRRGVKFLLSNSDTEYVRNRYRQFHQEFVEANRMINSDKSGRGEVSEILVRNY